MTELKHAVKIELKQAAGRIEGSLLPCPECGAELLYRRIERMRDRRYVVRCERGHERYLSPDELMEHSIRI